MKQGLALDIDETLSRTNVFWIESMSKLFGNPENLTPIELSKKYRYTQNVPYWQTPEANVWMEEARNSNDFQEHIPLIENAHNIVQKVNQIIPIAAYITARPEVVRPGTELWLKKHGFPEVRLIMRPDSISSAESTQWKAGVLEEMYPEVMGIVDDYPSLVDNLSVDYKGVVFLYDTENHTNSSKNIIPCPTWDDVYDEVLKYKARNPNINIS